MEREQQQQATIEGYNPLQIESGPFFISIRRRGNLKRILPAHRTVHLSTQDVVNRVTLDSIVEKFPNIEVIQIPPSLFAFKLAYVVDLSPYEAKGIRFKIQTLGDEFDFRRNPDPEYNQKKQTFLEALKDSERQQEFVRMLRYGKELFPEVFFAMRYFCGVNEIPWNTLVNVNATIEYLYESAEIYGKKHPSSLTSLVFELETSYRRLERI